MIKAVGGACGALAKRDRDEPAENSSNGAEGDDSLPTDTSDLDWEEVNESALQSGQGQSPEPLLVSIQNDSAVASAKRQGVTKKERQSAQRLHRSHLLCLLGRALLFDKAATDAELQVRLMCDPGQMVCCFEVSCSPSCLEIVNRCHSRRTLSNAGCHVVFDASGGPRQCKPGNNGGCTDSLFLVSSDLPATESCSQRGLS